MDKKTFFQLAGLTSLIIAMLMVIHFGNIPPPNKAFSQARVEAQEGND